MHSLPRHEGPLGGPLAYELLPPRGPPCLQPAAAAAARSSPAAAAAASSEAATPAEASDFRTTAATEIAASATAAAAAPRGAATATAAAAVTAAAAAVTAAGAAPTAAAAATAAAGGALPPACRKQQAAKRLTYLQQQEQQQRQEEQQQQEEQLSSNSSRSSSNRSSSTSSSSTNSSSSGTRQQQQQQNGGCLCLWQCGTWAQAREKRLRFTKPSLCIQSPTNRGATRQQRLLSYQAEDDSGASPSQLPPRWVDALDELHDDIAHIKEKMGQLQKLQQRRLLQVFGDSIGEAASGREVEVQTASLFRRCEVKLQQLRPQEGQGVDRLLQQNAQKAVAAQLQGLTQVFRQQQKAYLEGKRLSLRFRCDRVGSSPPASFCICPQGFSEEFGGQLSILEGEADVRREEVARVAQSVAELHQIFKDTATLVIEQGTVLDRIDYNLEQVADQTEQATTEIKKAEESRRSGRAAKCIFGLAVTIFVLVKATQPQTSPHALTCLAGHKAHLKAGVCRAFFLRLPDASSLSLSPVSLQQRQQQQKQQQQHQQQLQQQQQQGQ
ncbi:hypothetical protein Efla_006464 [Eimeria flavescens]